MEKQDEKINALIRFISQERLAPYYSAPEQLTVGLARYAWNIALCEALYPTLNIAEIALRNNVHVSLSALYGQQWYDNATLLRAEEREQIADAQALVRSLGKPVLPGRVIAGLSFGFWVTVLGPHYRQTLFPHIVKAVFPHLEATHRTTKFVSHRLHMIRFQLRNRVFHHEPIWKNRNLSRYHEELLETIGWLNPEALTFASGLDRFKEIYRQGHEAFIARFKS